MQFSSDVYTIRQLKENEWSTYKQMRLEALQIEPSMFRTSIPEEATLTDTEWKERIKHPRAVFVLLEKNTPIGMTSILLLKDEEAYLGQSYIQKEYRGIGLSVLLFKAPMKWARDLHLKKLSISHRESNIISKAANQRLGFKYTHRETIDWLDGTREDVLYYALDL